MKPYLYYKGLIKLAEDIKGTEIVHVGIRPYGFHAGNAMALFVYPYLLCERLETLGKRPKLRFIVSINDWEQDELDGPDYRNYLFNIYPKNTSLYFTKDENGCCKSTVHHWKPIIKRNLLILKKKFPDISLKFVNNSKLIEYRFCRKLLLETIRNPNKQLAILKKYSNKRTLRKPVSYAGAICPQCKSAHVI